jgi:hypothetical protein
MPKMMWWLATAFWGISVQVVNAYVMNCKVMVANEIPMKEWMSHYSL